MLAWAVIIVRIATLSVDWTLLTVNMPVGLSTVIIRWLPLNLMGTVSRCWYIDFGIPARVVLLTATLARLMKCTLTRAVSVRMIRDLASTFRLTSIWFSERLMPCRLSSVPLSRLASTRFRAMRTLLSRPTSCVFSLERLLVGCFSLLVWFVWYCWERLIGLVEMVGRVWVYRDALVWLVLLAVVLLYLLDCRLVWYIVS